jgi:hypothetical protein
MFSVFHVTNIPLLPNDDTGEVELRRSDGLNKGIHC